MSQETKESFTPPEGLDFLKLVFEQEDACEIETDERLPTRGKRPPLALNRLGLYCRSLTGWHPVGGDAQKETIWSSISVEELRQVGVRRCA